MDWESRFRRFPDDFGVLQRNLEQALARATDNMLMAQKGYLDSSNESNAAANAAIFAALVSVLPALQAVQLDITALRARLDKLEGPKDDHA